MPKIDNFCLVRIQVKNYDKRREAAFFYDVIFKMAVISYHLKIYLVHLCKYKLYVWPIFYTIFRGKDYNCAIEIEIIVIKVKCVLKVTISHKNHIFVLDRAI